MTIAYFSMEVGLDPRLPTYSGGLGVLAGDTLRGAADLGVPLVGMTLLYRQGYFRQQLDGRGQQTEGPAPWSPEQFLEPQAPRVTVTIEGRLLQVRAWRYLVRGVAEQTVPVYFLDTDLDSNSAWDLSLPKMPVWQFRCSAEGRRRDGEVDWRRLGWGTERWRQ